MPPIRVLGPGRRTARRRSDIEDLLSGVSERQDLERLFNHQVGLPDILRLAGRDIRSSSIVDLLESPDLPRDLKRLLHS